MAPSVIFQAVHPIGDTDTNALPVKEIGPAVGQLLSRRRRPRPVWTN